MRLLLVEMHLLLVASCFWRLEGSFHPYGLAMTQGLSWEKELDPQPGPKAMQKGHVIEKQLASRYRIQMYTVHIYMYTVYIHLVYIYIYTVH